MLFRLVFGVISFIFRFLSTRQSSPKQPRAKTYPKSDEQPAQDKKIIDAEFKEIEQ